MSTKYLWRVSATGRTETFTRTYQTRQAAEDRLLRFAAQGLAAIIERSDPIAWPDTEGAQ